MRRLKLIWDFRGPDSKKIAEHHEIHLKDYIKNKKPDFDISGVEKISDVHSITFMAVHESEMRVVRDDLKPHRGQVFQE